VTLTTVTLLAAHLTDENHEAFLDATRHKSKRDVERLVASLVPQPDISSSLRTLPPTAARQWLYSLEAGAQPNAKAGSRPAVVRREGAVASDIRGPDRQSTTAAPGERLFVGRVETAAGPRAVVAPLASDRYLLKITLRRGTNQARPGP
jgi:hypothetical protein